MKWNQFRLTTTTGAEDIVSSMLMDLGIQGVQIEDRVPLTEEDKEQMFVDILPDILEDDGKAYLTFYLEEEEDKGGGGGLGRPDGLASWATGGVGSALVGCTGEAR